MPVALSAFVLLVASVSAAAAGATPSPDCRPLCRVTCLKPITIADRWDDETPVPGYPSWQRNGYYDQEQFSDLNDNGLYDPGEPFDDTNANGVHDAEFYDPLLTGYLASQDLGALLRIKSNYWPVKIPVDPVEPGSSHEYQWLWANCAPSLLGVGDTLWTETGSLYGPTLDLLRAIQLLDPDALWDPACRCVVGSDFDVSPRLFVIAAHDPRIRLQPGKKLIHARKLMGLFLEAVESVEFVVRFAEVSEAEGDICNGSDVDGGFVFDCNPVQVEATTWGRIKAIHR